MIRYELLLTDGAERDLEEICDYIAEFDTPASADRVLDRLLHVIAGSAVFPDRGAFPRELSSLGIHAYRQVFFKPHRVIYRVSAQQVFIYLIVDGRRDMQSLLMRRLLA